MNIKIQTIKAIFAISLSGFLSSCAVGGGLSTRGSYVQNNLEIFTPVRLQHGIWSSPVIELFNDGGTKHIIILDAKNRRFDVYKNHRIGYEASWGEYYIGGMPGSSSATRIVNKARFEEMVLKDIKIPN